MSRSGNYQDSITAPLSHAFNNDAVGKDDEDEQDEVKLVLDRSSTILSSVEKACAFSPVSYDLLTSFHIAPKNHPCDTIKSPMQAELAQSSNCISTWQGHCHGKWSLTTSHVDPRCQDLVVVHTPNDA
jgi:hypothetical protein